MVKWPFRHPAHETTPLPAPGDPHWERALLNHLALEFIRDQRRRRRWGNFFKLAALVYLVAALVPVLYLVATEAHDTADVNQDHAALVEINGLIAADTAASADRVVAALRKAFAAERAKGVILRIDSPGGSPVQAGYINREIRRLREKHPDKPVYAVAADLCASAAYYIAVAADRIYVDPASLVGSIGVRLDSFGLDRAIAEWGIERRLLVAGERKGILDPFLPLAPADVAFIKGLLEGIHRQFIAAVKEGRGDRLKGGEELFSGLFWTGEESIALGLADGVGSSGSVAREVLGVEEIIKYSKKHDLLDRLAERFGMMLAETLRHALATDATLRLR